MTKEQVIQQRKNEALNRITQIYHPLYKFSYNQYDEDSYAEQREYEIKSIVEDLNRDIKKIKESFKVKEMNHKANCS